MDEHKLKGISRIGRFLHLNNGIIDISRGLHIHPLQDLFPAVILKGQSVGEQFGYGLNKKVLP
jgi:hypothetical protein